MANAIRALSMDAVQKANSGHPGMPMGMADVATVLYSEFLKFDPADPQWPDRDRFVLSAGHGSMLLYSLLHLTGYPGMDMGQLENFRQLGSKTAGHPEFGHAPGIETTTGPLGQGIANAVGMALAERLLNARLGDDLVDHHTYCIAGDGCLMEGISHEAISLAGHLKLGRLIVLWDDNSISIDGPTNLSVSDNQIARFAASGWNTVQVDGHDTKAISAALAKAKADSSKPWLIACKTIIGYGAPNKQGKSSTHGEPLGVDEVKGAREKLGWSAAPFEVPLDVLDSWRGLGARGAKEHAAWSARLAKATPEARSAIEKPAAKSRTKAIVSALDAAKTAFAADTNKRATRVWSQMCLEHLIPVVPEMIGGSADLTPSNGTRTKHHTDVAPGNFAGIVHSLRCARAWHGGSNERPRLAWRHHSVWRHVPRFHRLLPAVDPVVGAHGAARRLCDDARLHRSRRRRPDAPAGRTSGEPSRDPEPAGTAPRRRHRDGGVLGACIERDRQANDPGSDAAGRADDAARKARCGESSAKGGYVVSGGDKRDVTLIATGSEVGLAAEAAATLAKEGIHACVVSLPSFELFRKQPEKYRMDVLGNAPRIAIEAAVAQGWHEFLRQKDSFIGMSSFGASAPAGKLFEHFGITAGKLAEAARGVVKGT